MRATLAAIVIALAAGAAASAADRPSGLDVWRSCRDDMKLICPNVGLLDPGAIKHCMTINFSRLGARCQTMAIRYREGSPDFASHKDRGG